MDSVDIVPLVGALPIRFGMHKREVDKKLGKPYYTFADPTDGMTDARYLNINIGYDTSSKLVTSIILLKGLKACFQGQDLFSLNSPADFVYQYSQNAVLTVGCVGFLDLNMYITGYDDSVKVETTIHLESNRNWAKYESLLVPWKPAPTPKRPRKSKLK